MANSVGGMTGRPGLVTLGHKGTEKTGSDRSEMQIKDEFLAGVDHPQKSLKNQSVPGPQKPDPDKPDPEKPVPKSGASWFDRDGFLEYNRDDSDAVGAMKMVAAAVIGVPVLCASIGAVVYLALQVPIAGLAMVCIAAYAISHAGGIG